MPQPIRVLTSMAQPTLIETLSPREIRKNDEKTPPKNPAIPAIRMMRWFDCSHPAFCFCSSNSRASFSLEETAIRSCSSFSAMTRLSDWMFTLRAAISAFFAAIIGQNLHVEDDVRLFDKCGYSLRHRRPNHLQVRDNSLTESPRVLPSQKAKSVARPQKVASCRVHI